MVPDEKIVQEIVQPSGKEIPNENAINKNAESYYKSCISLPIYPSLSLKDHNYIISKLKKFFNING